MVGREADREIEKGRGRGIGGGQDRGTRGGREVDPSQGRDLGPGRDPGRRDPNPTQSRGPDHEKKKPNHTQNLKKGNGRIQNQEKKIVHAQNRVRNRKVKETNVRVRNRRVKETNVRVQNQEKKIDHIRRKRNLMKNQK